ncbi:chymotrypsin-like elastase family member 2A isoform X2 [Anticarsia gemmatalis]|uniref:chymotrypsin-like elastase family member 2A isoform X2 n=1 Tax=Anticarsia gemmatalis TaxID=129554 RepID=UPI003F75AAEB
MIPVLFLVVALSVPTFEQATGPTSPCPEVFEYLPPGSEDNRWYGNIKLTTDTTLLSLLLDIELDRKADLLGNWIGEVATKDNMNFKIENTELRITPDKPVDLRFFVKYDLISPAPQLQVIKFNGREICDVKALKPITPAPAITVSPSTGTRTPETLNTTVVPPANNFGPQGEQAQCGTVVMSPIGPDGKKTMEGQWPWQVALYETQLTKNEYICGGTLVTHWHVLTAAHCVTRRDGLVDKYTLSVNLGRHNLRTITWGTQTNYVANIIVHPDYNGALFDRDLAILELRDRVPYSRWVRPACLWPEEAVDLNIIIGIRGCVVGWGLKETGVVPELSLLEMPVVDQETCLRSHQYFFVRYTSNYTYCAGDRSGKSLCNGDSGGGMVFESQGIWYLRGLVSATVAQQKQCDPTHYVVFTDLAKQLQWLRLNLYEY